MTTATQARLTAPTVGAVPPQRKSTVSPSGTVRREPTELQLAIAEMAVATELSPARVQDLLNGGHSVYALVATFNTCLLEHGLIGDVARRMLPVEQSVQGGDVPDLHQALADENIPDHEEDIAQTRLQLALETGALTLALLDDWLRKSAHARYRAERAERSGRRVRMAMAARA